MPVDRAHMSVPVRMKPDPKYWLNLTMPLESPIVSGLTIKDRAAHAAGGKMA